MSDYQISDEDIDVVVRYMKIFHPEKADRAYCKEALARLKAGLFKIARNNPDDIEEIYQQNEKYLNSLR